MNNSRTAGHGFTTMNKVQLVRGGKDYFDLLLKLIGEAENTIHLHTYIFDYDDTGKQVAEALKEATHRKVRVYLMLDGYASQSLPKAAIQEMKDSGILFRLF